MSTTFHNNIDIITTKMNVSANSRRPFLFGVNFELTEGFFIEDPLKQNEILFQIKSVSNKLNSINEYPKTTFRTKPISYDSYKEKFNIVHKGLRRGDSFLTNLTIKTPIETNLSLEDIFAQSKVPYSLCIPDRFVCFSPERFVKIANGRISSNPMKGTINANIPDAESIILSDFKETAEHNTIVDLIRNDLSISAHDVKVEQYRYIDKIKTNNVDILQVSSMIEGQLPHNYRAQIGDIFFSMLPAGSICGAPKQATVDLIKLAEGEKRGYYTGVFGYFDGVELDSAVLIRFVEKDGDQLFFRSGGGITAYSKCEEEYQEVLNKIYLPLYE
ncbi:aminodeoxychorismate synthase component I [Dysgonomonas sp. ZJ709]|uniref:aminodeoxychorismate synthase component I n=1 Tax=Dysgonomonas sp. ZJ709 TaxID=2709797 RepID=UPI0013EA09B3|nr:aminodeoxychorismate synthase component I [Dysgonomonas sp. ZJ709]